MPYSYLVENKKVSEIGKVLIEALIKRKIKEQQAEKLLNRWMITTIICLAIGVFYLTLSLSTSSNILVGLTEDLYPFIYIGLFAFCFFQMRYSKKKFTKYEKEYEELRYELIERQEELWNTIELWEARIDMYHYLKGKYDINLFHR